MLAVVHIGLCVVVLGWNLYMAGRITSIHSTPAPMSALSAVAGLLLMPALFILLANESLLTSRALVAVAWAWPAVAVLIALQAIYALTRGLVAPAIGIPIAAYDIALAIIYVIRYAMFSGMLVSEPLLSLAAAETSAVAFSTGINAFVLPYYLHIPMLAPATRGRRGFGTLARSTMAALAAVWVTVLALAVPSSAKAVHSYDRYIGERLQERPDSDFTVGLKVFSTLSGGPSPLALASDIALADSLGTTTLSLYLSPSGASRASLDSLARALESRRSALTLVVALDWRGASTPHTRASRQRFLAARLADVDRIVRRLHPEYLVPVLDPTGAASTVVGRMPIDAWERFLRDAAKGAHRVDSSVKVMVHVGGTSTRDSALYAWAAHPATPVDAIGFSVSPGADGAATLDARLQTLDRWLAATASRKEQWVLEADAYPRAHGELSQERALWGTLAWATSRHAIRGVIIVEASDYESPLGLRAPDGRLRPAAFAVRQAVRALTGNGS
ncbi:MAG TPA: hypothetical protein VF166_00545 [Gemmatimonadaceae bacterium]